MAQLQFVTVLTTYCLFIYLFFLSSVYFECRVQGMITLVLNCIDRLNVYNTSAHFADFAGEEAGEYWKEIVNLLYELLGEPPVAGMTLACRFTCPVDVW